MPEKIVYLNGAFVPDDEITRIQNLPCLLFFKEGNSFRWANPPLTELIMPHILLAGHG